MSFLDLDFPRDVASGVVGGPERRVDIVALASGEEERNARWKNSRRSYDAGFGIRSVDDLATVIAFFEETGGPLHSFRFRDWSDFSSAASADASPAATDQSLGTGDGAATEFQLVKTYGSLNPYLRKITKPVAGSVLVALDGAAQGAGWSVNNLTGILSFLSPPAPGVVVTAGFFFDVPVRFDTQSIATDMAFFSESEGRGVGTIPEIQLIEVRE
ncbi:DUF2460 domain-containing protein [Phaeobacter sp. 11ANDIMAR09]|uniref:DUF2460 domain-containing protein n=1 Tax=Phaeobacter sp. 11ANDIMAR09 TaxID=1225647 RepID=UPI0006C83635|nr:DUF2460 domain-containing protein [Phaeobacter sp. 11ANDIMAR09]KPD10516.1 glycoside hydrolase family 24 [Phaeobacter sp. 11ANDIMAR09]